MARRAVGRESVLTTSTTTAKRVKNSAIYWIVRAMIAMLSWLPHRLAVAVGRAIGLLGWLVARRERLRAERNLELIRSQPAVVPRRLVREMFGHLGRSALECVVLDRLRPQLRQASGPVRFSTGSDRALDLALSEGKGVLYVTAHLGNWELMAAAVALRAPVTVFFKPSYDPRFTRLITEFRLRNGVIGLDVTRPGHIRRAVAALRAGQIVGILLDQPVVGGRMVPFLGRRAPTSLVVPILARITGAPVVVGVIHREAPCQHAISLVRIPQNLGVLDPEEGTRVLCQHLERAILSHPEQWIWSLDRWRSTESTTLSSPNANCIPASNN